MQKLHITITRKWIKDLRNDGLSNQDIILRGIAEALNESTSILKRDRIMEDLRLAGLITDEVSWQNI